MRIFSRFSASFYRLMGLTIAGVLESAVAHAQVTGGVGGVATNLNSQFASMGKVVTGGSYLAGFGFSAMGLMKLKEAASSQNGQVKYGDALWRLGVGGGLIAVPTVANVANGTFFGPGQTNNTQEGTINFN